MRANAAEAIVRCLWVISIERVDIGRTKSIHHKCLRLRQYIDENLFRNELWVEPIPVSTFQFRIVIVLNYV